jgi:hypothetical protein
MFPPSLINKLLVLVAKVLKVSPGVAHVLLMLLVTIGFGVSNPRSWAAFTDPIFLMIWLGVCTFVVLITWVTKGEYRKIWWQVKPWQSR